MISDISKVGSQKNLPQNPPQKTLSKQQLLKAIHVFETLASHLSIMSHQPLMKEKT